MKKGTKVKILRKNIYCNILLEILMNNPKLLGNLTVEYFERDKNNENEFNIYVKEIPNYYIYFNEYIIVKKVE